MFQSSLWVWKSKELSMLSNKFIEQVSWVNSHLNVVRKLLEKLLIFFCLNCLIAVHFPLVLEVLLDLLLKIAFQLFTFIKSSYKSEKFGKVITIIEWSINGSDFFNNLYKISHDIGEDWNTSQQETSDK